MKLIRRQATVKKVKDGKEIESYNKGRRYMIDAITAISFADVAFKEASGQPEAEVSGVAEEANNRLAEIRKIQAFIKATWKS